MKKLLILSLLIAAPASAQVTLGNVTVPGKAATVSLPSCTSVNIGGLIYDTTTNTVKVCDATNAFVGVGGTQLWTTTGYTGAADNGLTVTLQGAPAGNNNNAAAVIISGGDSANGRGAGSLSLRGGNSSGIGNPAGNLSLNGGNGDAGGNSNGADVSINPGTASGLFGTTSGLLSLGTVSGRGVNIGRATVTNTIAGSSTFTGNAATAAQVLTSITGFTEAIDIASITGVTCLDTAATTNITSTANAACEVGLSTTPTANLSFSCFVSTVSATVGRVTIRACNVTAIAIDPASATYGFTIINR